MKIAVIVDQGAVQKFALNCIDAIEGAESISVFSCTNSRYRRRPVRHGVYYALNLISVRNPLARPVPVDAGVKSIDRLVEFQSGCDGAWQTLPDTIVEQLSAFDVVLKFGMGLLRVPPKEQLPVPILSYHHGDPERYRGRPAGFWEIADGARVVGQMVQVISNRLDAGDVVAFGETRVFPWSWRATLMESFRHSPLLINQAIRNARLGQTLDKPVTGKNCRLPSNAVSARLAARMSSRKARRIAYGAAMHKAWRVSTAPLDGQDIDDVIARGLPSSSNWATLAHGKQHSFFADPFFDETGAVLVEAMDASSGLGQIVRIGEKGERPLAAGSGHWSYPSTSQVGGRELVIPETASWSPPVAYEIRDDTFVPVATLDVEGADRLVDPTLLEHDGSLFLFANIRSIGSGALYLWTAKTIDGRFCMHPQSPILLSPIGARMGGAVLRQGERLLRFGQDFSADYGDGLIAFEIEELSIDKYRERKIGDIRCTDCRGPHTLNLKGERLLFDWYDNKFDPLAGFRRVRAALAARRGRSAA